MSNTDVELFIVPWENDYKHVLYFNNVTEQNNYFTTKALLKKSGLTYQRKDNTIRYPEHIDNIYTMNYLRYRNTDYNSKWYYAFITDMTYVNDGMTEIHIETDVMQTWFFNHTLKPSFIEREHVNDDTPGVNLIDEGFSVSDYTLNNYRSAGIGSTSSGESDNPLYIVIGVTEESTGNSVGMRVYNGIPSGVAYYVYPIGQYNKVSELITTYATAGKSDAIICMFLAPAELVKPYLTNTEGFINTSIAPSVVYINNGGTESASNRVFQISTTTIDSYIPKNKKLLTYPYRYLMVSNNNGTEAIYRYENFGNTTYSYAPQFAIQGCLTPGCSIRMIPLNYKNCNTTNMWRCDVEGINLGKFPTLNWNSDYYTNWLTQNGVNIGIQAITSAGSIGAGLYTGNIGMVAGGVSTAANTINSIYQADLVPHQSHGNINCGDVVTSGGVNDFHFYDMCLKKEQAIVIDSFFTMYGYKVNRVGLPLKAHRSNFWYTKTIDCDVDGFLPNKDIQKIKNIYDSGVTFWKSDSNMGNYLSDNGIV